MTTPPTPAGWYPDPEHAGQLRYWDGGAWTEHRSPSHEPSTAAVAQEPTAPEPSTEATAAGAEHVGAHRAPDSDAASDAPPGAEQPTAEVPLRPWSFEPPPLEPEATSAEAFGSEPDLAPEPTSAEQTSESAPAEPAPEPAAAEPTADTPTPEPAPYADATTPTPAEPPAVEPPAGTEPQAPVDNRKLIVGFGGAIAALLVVLALAAVYAFVIHKPESKQLSSGNSKTSTSTTTVTTTTETPTGEPAPPPAGAVDGPLTFAVTGVESTTTVTDPENDFLSKDAQGEFIVVHLTVSNTSPDPGQFLGTSQKLKAGDQVYTVDDQATFYVGGGFVDIPPGGQVEVGLAYDVPTGTVPDTIELHADPTSPGVELPVA